MERCDSYYPGECTWGACELAPWIPDGLGNGGQWAADAPAYGIRVTDVPTVGSVVSYCPGDGYSEYGHCGLVTAVYSDGTFLVREMNYVAFDEYDDRDSNMSDVCGFLLPPGVQPGQGGVSAPLGGGAGAGGGTPAVILDGYQNLQWWTNTGAQQLWARLANVNALLGEIAP